MTRRPYKHPALSAPYMQQLPPTTEEAKKLLEAWRAAHPKIAAFWASLDFGDLEARIVAQTGTDFYTVFAEGGEIKFTPMDLTDWSEPEVTKQPLDADTKLILDVVREGGIARVRELFHPEANWRQMSEERRDEVRPKLKALLKGIAPDKVQG